MTDHYFRLCETIKNLTDSELRDDPKLSRISSKFLIGQEGRVDVLYAPFEHINTQAKVMLIGITPGRTQLTNAIKECRLQLLNGASKEQALVAAKSTAAFSGPMRPKLIAMMDAIGLHSHLGISSCSALFEGSKALMQTTSLLRNPVFVAGSNYNGTPDMTQSGLLKQQLMEGFVQEAQSLPDALLLPLGDKVSKVLSYLARQGHIDGSRILNGLPHPSGANSERIAYFLGRKDRAKLSKKTDPDKLDMAKMSLISKLASIKRTSLSSEHVIQAAAQGNI